MVRATMYNFGLKIVSNYFPGSLVFLRVQVLIARFWRSRVGRRVIGEILYRRLERAASLQRLNNVSFVCPRT